MNKRSTKAKRKTGRRSPRKREVLPENLKQINLNAAGIDIGSQAHYVAVPSDRAKEAVRSFGCLTPELHAMAEWLQACAIDTVVMESTGVYWIPVMQVLESYGFEVKLVDARQAKNVPGRKTDVLDCQWLQQLHTFGLLRAAFRPEPDVCVLRTLWRHRTELVESCAKQIHLMHKALEQMNLQLHKVLSDITGLTGMRMLRAILAGERDAMVLARMKHALVKSSEETIAKALTGEYREEHLFTLRQSVDLYDIYQRKIAECDERVQDCLEGFEAKGDVKDLASKPVKATKSRRRKNQPYFDLTGLLYQMTGVDLTHIDGVDALTALKVVSECGYDMRAFPSEKHFASWLTLCPNHRITGGRVKSRRTRQAHNRAAQALRVAAQSLHRSQTALGAYYRRMRTRLGAPKAITATAHKLAHLIYRMLKYGEDYVDKGQEYYEEKYKERIVQNLKNRARALGYELTFTETGEVVT
jgi:transposase